MGHGQNELRDAAGLIFKLRIIVAVQFKDQSLYANFSAPQFWLVPPHFVCFGDGTGAWRNG